MAEDTLGVEQHIYVAVASQVTVGLNIFNFRNSKSEITYRHILNLLTRINFVYKARKIYRDLIGQFQCVEKFDMIHAHTWYSDGITAYQLYLKYGIPYIVTIRNTDLNLFFKYMIHLRALGIQILLNAKKIIFISEAYKCRFLETKAIRRYLPDLENKIEVIPNGVNDFWISNISERKKRISNPVKLIFIGNFSNNKNLLNLIKAVETLIREGMKLHLDIIGGGGNKEKSVMKLMNSKNYITYYGVVSDKDLLKSLLMDADIFTMPSFHETFGLVYVEALSQGIPVLYTKNEGIDGLYNKIGEAVYPKEVSDISRGIKKIVLDYPSYKFSPDTILQKHSWTNIAKQYIDIYNS